MPAPVGNRFWEARSSHGRTPIFNEPEKLWDACVEYFDWIAENPLKEGKLVSFQGSSVLEEVPKMRAMTIGGLCIFLGIARSTWPEYGKKEGFSEVVHRVEEIIREQKFTGAAADLLNPNIIARDLGLADRSELTGKDGAPIKTEDVSDPATLARKVAFLLMQGTRSTNPEGETK